jgi:hypothetical protein
MVPIDGANQDHNPIARRRGLAPLLNANEGPMAEQVINSLNAKRREIEAYIGSLERDMQ